MNLETWIGEDGSEEQNYCDARGQDWSTGDLIYAMFIRRVSSGNLDDVRVTKRLLRPVRYPRNGFGRVFPPCSGGSVPWLSTLAWCIVESSLIAAL